MFAAANSTKLRTRWIVFEPGRKHRIQWRGRRRLPIGEHPAQLCGGHALAAQEFGQQADAEPRDRRAVQHRRIVDRELRPHAHFGARRGLGHLEAIFGAFARRREQRVIAQAFGPLRRRMLQQIGGRRAQHRRRRAEQPRAELRVIVDARANRHVPFGALAGIEHHVERDVRKAVEEARHQRRQQHAAIGRIGDHAQRSLARGREGLRELAYLLDLDADGARMRQHRLTGSGEENPPGRALHELQPDGFFEVGDGAADRDLGHAVGAGGGGKAIELDHSRENGELSGGP